MRNLNKYYSLILAALAVIGAGCDSDDDMGSIPDWNENIGAVTLLSPNPDQGFFNALNALGDEEVNFELDVDGFGVTQVENVELMLTYIEKDGSVDEEGKPVDLVYDPVLLREVSSFPADIRISGAEVASALGISADDLKVGDRFQLTFPINTADGRRLTVPLSSDLCQQPAQPSFGGCSFTWSVSCPTVIANGTYRYEASGASVSSAPADPNPSGLTGTVELTGNNGSYWLSDLTVNLYDYWYCAPFGGCGSVAGTFTEVCNELSITSQPTFFRNDFLNGSGSYDPATGVIQLRWVNAFGDTAEYTLTPM